LSFAQVRIMAKARKHEMSKEELRAPDEVQVALKGFWEKLYKYRKLVMLGVAGLIAVGIAIWIIGASERSGIEGHSNELREAAKAVGAPVGPEPVLDPRVAKLPRPPRFADEGARVAAVNDGLTQFLTARGGDAVAEVATLTAANAKLNKADAAGALADVTTWFGRYGDSIAKPVALDLKARAQIATGKKDEAMTTLDELSKLVGPGVLRAAALSQVGDLQNPALNAGAGDAAKAKNAYQAALAALPPEEEDKMSMITGKPGLRGQIENHLGLLP